MRVDYPMTDVDTLCNFATAGKANKLWYHQAHQTVNRISHTFGISDRYVADVLAITSPRVSVTRNIRATRYYFQSGYLPSDLIKTTHLALDHYESCGEIRGPKTSRFARCLMLEEEPVVLDVWMAKALGVPQKWFGTKNGYGKGEDRIREVASKVGMTPAQTQASIWGAVYQMSYKSGKTPEFKE